MRDRGRAAAPSARRPSSCSGTAGVRGLGYAEFKLDQRNGRFVFIEVNCRTVALDGILPPTGIDLVSKAWSELARGEPLRLQPTGWRGSWIHLQADLACSLQERLQSPRAPGALPAAEGLRRLVGVGSPPVPRANGDRPASGGEAMSVLDRPKDVVYRLHQDVWSTWARRRYRDELAAVERFLLFVGYPRSGHSIVGAMLNAHRDAVVAHELDAPPLIVGGCSRDELFSRILARAYWFNMRGNRANYPYAVPGQWQGRFATLRVIGDKRGGSVTHTPSPITRTSSIGSARSSASRCGSCTSCATRSTTSARSRSGTSCRSRRASTSTSATGRRRRGWTSSARRRS